MGERSGRPWPSVSAWRVLSNLGAGAVRAPAGAAAARRHYKHGPKPKLLTPLAGRQGGQAVGPIPDVGEDPSPCALCRTLPLYLGAQPLPTPYLTEHPQPAAHARTNTQCEITL